MALVTRKAGIGGGNLVEVFRFANSTTAETTATFSYDRTESTSLAGYPTRGNLTADIVNKIDNNAIHDHLNAYISGSSPVKEITQDYENGDSSVSKEAVTSADTLIFIHYGAIDADAKRKVTAAAFVYSGDTGNQSYAKDGVNGITVQMTAVERSAAVTIPSACFNTAYVTGYTAALSIGANTNSVITFYTAS